MPKPTGSPDATSQRRTLFSSEAESSRVPSDWHEEIQACDFGLLLISPAFLPDEDIAILPKLCRAAASVVPSALSNQHQRSSGAARVWVSASRLRSRPASVAALESRAGVAPVALPSRSRARVLRSKPEAWDPVAKAGHASNGGRV